VLEGPERGYQRLGKTLFEGSQGLEHLPALISLFIMACLRNFGFLFYAPLALETLRLGGLSQIHPLNRSFKEVLHRKDPFR
jgi:hypothetical protein